ncbi:hypothetical protein VSPL_41140 [Vibrio splendidus]|nr:hypothetical protein VSPL_41140 [Vibrio splendidus]
MFRDLFLLILITIIIFPYKNKPVSQLKEYLTPHTIMLNK